MLKSIEELLKLQDWDKKLIQHQKDLDAIQPHLDYLAQKLESTQTNLKSEKESLASIQSSQKQLELDIATQEEKIRKYSHQQLETKKNDEYQALNNEIDRSKSIISETEDKVLDIMDLIEKAQSTVQATSEEAEKMAADVKVEISETQKKKTYLESTISEYKAKRAEQVENVDVSILKQYERLCIKKPGTVVVGIDRGMCGGCHMKLTTSAILTAKGGHEVSTCPNCGRILYYLPGMEIADGD